MAEAKESLREKLIVAFVQTLFFGALLAVLGYWLDRQLETYKHALAEQTEMTKVLLQSLAPQIQQRRDAYLEFWQAAREARSTLEVYYHLAKGPPEHNRRRGHIRDLENALGIGSGTSGGGSWATHGDAVDVIRNLVSLRERYEDVSSELMESAVDTFIDQAMQDLRDGAKETNDTEEFHEAARRRIREAFDTLSAQIEKALGHDQIPLQ